MLVVDTAVFYDDFVFISILREKGTSAVALVAKSGGASYSTTTIVPPPARPAGRVACAVLVSVAPRHATVHRASAIVEAKGSFDSPTARVTAASGPPAPLQKQCCTIQS